MHFSVAKFIPILRAKRVRLFGLGKHLVKISKDQRKQLTQWQRQKNILEIQARIAHLVAYRLGNGEVPGSDPGKGKNFSMKKEKLYIVVLSCALLLVLGD